MQTFHPNFTHQIWEDEKLFGYQVWASFLHQSISIDIKFTSASLVPSLSVVSQPKPSSPQTAIQAQLQRAFVHSKAVDGTQWDIVIASTDPKGGWSQLHRTCGNIDQYLLRRWYSSFNNRGGLRTLLWKLQGRSSASLLAQNRAPDCLFNRGCVLLGRGRCVGLNAQTLTGASTLCTRRTLGMTL